MRFCHVGQADLEPLTSGDSPALTSQSAGIIKGELLGLAKYLSLDRSLYHCGRSSCRSEGEGREASVGVSIEVLL